MATVLVNQVPYDFQSLETEILVVGADGVAGSTFGIIEGLEEFDYTCTINRTKVYGRNRLPIMRTEGDAEFDASITIHRYWWHLVRSSAKDLGVPLAQLEMVLNFTFYAPDQEIHTDTLTGVRVAEIGNSGSHGPDPQMVTVPLDIMNIYWDGEDIFGGTL